MEQTATDTRTRIIKRASVVGMMVNTVLAALKVGVGLFSGSLALVADGFDSATDVLTSLISLVAARFMSAPPDAEHPYGHGKAEQIAGKLISFIIFSPGRYEHPQDNHKDSEKGASQKCCYISHGSSSSPSCSNQLLAMQNSTSHVPLTAQIIRKLNIPHPPSGLSVLHTAPTYAKAATAVIVFRIPLWIRLRHFLTDRLCHQYRHLLDIRCDFCLILLWQDPRQHLIKSLNVKILSDLHFLPPAVLGA